jgi:hypothetical protein
VVVVGEQQRQGEGEAEHGQRQRGRPRPRGEAAEARKQAVQMLFAPGAQRKFATWFGRRGLGAIFLDAAVHGRKSSISLP